MNWKIKKPEKYFYLVALILWSVFFSLQVLADNNSASHPNDSMKTSMDAVMLNPLKQQLIGVKKYTVQEKKLVKTIRTVGRVVYDERLLREVNLKVEGWVEKLHADFAGKYVRQGDPLFTLYSPELLNAQEEYLLATTSGRGGSRLKSSARDRLLLWDISKTQIEQLDRTRKPATLVEIMSPLSGYIISKSVIEGGHVKPGQTLFKIADIKKVWVLGDIYEFEIPLIKLGQKVRVTSQSLPEQSYSGVISYIYPSLDPKTRSIKIRIAMDNPGEKFKPEMFTNIRIEVDQGVQLAVPESAVLQSGIRNIIFLDKGNGIFVPKEVAIGSLVNGFYPIRKGLTEGDVIVSSANFFLDSESKLMATMEGMMGLIGMGDWKMEHSRMGEMEGIPQNEGSTSKTPPMNMKPASTGQPQ